MNIRPDPLYDFLAMLPVGERFLAQLIIERVTVILASDRTWLIDVIYGAMQLQELTNDERIAYIEQRCDERYTLLTRQVNDDAHDAT